MPTDTFDREHGDVDPSDVPEFSADDLVFATHVARDSASPARDGHGDLDFALAPRPSTESPAPRRRGGAEPSPSAGAAPGAHSADSFVIREPRGAGPASPVDALVVGSPTPAPDPGASQAAPVAFLLSTSTAGAGARATDEPPWMVRDAQVSEEPATRPSPRGWGMRAAPPNGDRPGHLAMLRLREEAVHVAWKAAWIAVTAADPALAKKPSA